MMFRSKTLLKTLLLAFSPGAQAKAGFEPGMTGSVAKCSTIVPPMLILLTLMSEILILLLNLTDLRIHL
jgi:hypothetical protein